ncbi:MAG: HAD family hydrolase [Acidobacteriaceae bacterium]|nr:HAD family hydrolase [Acidobacteriaceae bacterium]
MTPRLIAIDMDGTLLGSDGKVSERNRAALALARACGVEAVMATGRRHSYAMHVLRGLGLCESNALISSNGTVIRTIGAELLHRSHLSLETARWLIEHARAYRSSMVMTFDTVQPDGDDTRGALVSEREHVLNHDIDKWMEANRRYFLHVEDLAQALEGDAPIQAMLCGPVATMHRAEEHLLSSPRVTRWELGSTEVATEIVLHRTEYPQRDLMIVDILPSGCSKASALRRLVEMRGITTAEMMAIGDNWNDLPMLELVGYPVLMANAPERLRELAVERGWEIAPANTEDGVAWAIERALEAVPALR